MVGDIILLLMLFWMVSLTWEVFHSLLYNWDKKPLKNKVEYYIPRILWSTLGDLGLLSSVFVIVSLINFGFSWIYNLGWLDYLLIFVLGLSKAILIEIRGLSEPRWAYKKVMPTVFGIGLSPLVQLFCTFLICIFLLRLV